MIAVGEKGALLHFDGASWRTLKNPDAARPDETFTGACHANGRVYICSQDGRLLFGGMSGLTVLAQTEDIQLSGLAFLGDRLLFAVGQDGVAELQESTLKIIRSTFHSTYIAAGKGRLFFLDASSETAYIEYDPKQLDLPWSYVTFCGCTFARQLALRPGRTLRVGNGTRHRASNCARRRSGGRPFQVQGAASASRASRLDVVEGQRLAVRADRSAGTPTNLELRRPRLPTT